MANKTGLRYEHDAYAPCFSHAIFGGDAMRLMQGDCLELMKEIPDGTVDMERKKAYNESADREQWKNYRNRLGNDIPSSFKDFQTLKYEDAESYKNLVDLYRYKGRVPEATKLDYELYKRVKATGIVGTIRIPPYPIDADALEFKDEHGKRHGCSIEDARSYIKNAKCSVRRKQWDGFHTNYYSFEGTTCVKDDIHAINTAYPEEEYKSINRKILEVFR